MVCAFLNFSSTDLYHEEQKKFAECVEFGYQTLGENPDVQKAYAVSPLHAIEKVEKIVACHWAYNNHAKFALDDT